VLHDSPERKKVTSAVKGVETAKRRSGLRRGSARGRLREESEIDARGEGLDARRADWRMRANLRWKVRQRRVHRHDAQRAMELAVVDVAGSVSVLEARLRADEVRDLRAVTRQGDERPQRAERNREDCNDCEESLSRSHGRPF
jgi:hypothetical protein